MRYLAVIAVLSTLSTGAGAQSGFFSGGAAEGSARSQELELQRRALELDARDGGSRMERLQNRHQLDAIERQLKLNNELLEDHERRRRIRGY